MEKLKLHQLPDAKFISVGLLVIPLTDNRILSQKA